MEIAMELTTTDALRAYAKMMNTLNVDHLEPFLSDDFNYSSQWVFEEIKSKKAFIAYIKPKLDSISKSKSRVYAEMGKLMAYGGGPCVIIAQGDANNLVATVLATVNEGKIIQLDLCQIPPPSSAVRSGEFPS